MGVFSLVAVVMITVMGLAMLRTTQIQEKWKIKLSKAMDDETDKGLGNTSRRYALFILPLITLLREGLEAIVFIGGVSVLHSFYSVLSRCWRWLFGDVGMHRLSLVFISEGVPFPQFARDGCA